MAQDMSFEDFFETMDEIELQGIVGKEIDDAVDYVDNWVSPIRSLATKYYRGEPFGDEEEGRSQVVSLDVARLSLWTCATRRRRLCRH